MERCEPGWFYRIQADNGLAICTGYAEDAKPLLNLADEGHGITRKSKGAFLKHRREIGPVQEVHVSWDEGCIDTETVVIGKNGNQITLSGFGVGYRGEGFVGLIWLLDLCGVAYNKDDVARIDVEKFTSVSFQSMYQTANTVYLTKIGERHPTWSANIFVSRQYGEQLSVHIPDEQAVNLIDDPGELIDIVLAEIALRGIKWTADPHISNNDASIAADGAEWNKIMEIESARIGWNFTPLR